MKKFVIVLSCAVGLLMVPSRAADEKHTALHDQMEAMNDAFKAFRRETDPVKGATQARLAQQAALKSASEVPELVTAMPEGPEKAKALVTYRMMMGKLFVTLCEVEQAFLNGKIEDVTKIVDSLKEQKKAGHDKFMDEDKE
jgi:soluble cytochrome b562